MNKLAYWRAKRVLTVRQLSEKAGVGANTISVLENGKRPANLTTLGKLAAALEIDVTELAELNTQGDKDKDENDNKAA